MLKKFTQNLFFLIILNLLIKPFWIFGIDRTIQNIVGAEQYGFYVVLFNFSLIFNMLTDFGLTNFNTKNIAQNQQLVSKHVSRLIWLKVFLAFGYITISLLAAFLIGYSFSQIKFLLILVLNQVIASFLLYLRSNLSGLHLFKTDSVLSITDKGLLIIISGILILKYPVGFQIEWLVYSQTVAYLVTTLIAFLLVLRQTGWIRIRYDYRFILAILKKTAPFALLIFLMTVYTRIDFVMLERILDNGNLYSGIYAQAYRITDAFSMFAYLFAALLLPIFSKMIKDKVNLGNMVKKSATILLVPVLILVIVIIFHSSEIMNLLYHQHANQSYPVLNILTIGFIGIASIYIFGTLLTANGNLKQLIVISGLGVIINITLNFLLIPKYNYIGAAISSMLTQLMMAVTQIYLAYKFFNFKIIPKEAIKWVLFITIILLQGYFIKLIDILSWQLSFFVNIILSFLWVFVLRVIKFEQIHKFIGQLFR
ncbi:MAG: oligosaccharide flippase family protein [Bacteroidota bacterium]